MLSVLGESFPLWVWGDFGAGSSVLIVFAVLHYVLPLAVLGIIGVHVTLLHECGSTSTTGLGCASLRSSCLAPR